MKKLLYTFLIWLMLIGVGFSYTETFYMCNGGTNSDPKAGTCAGAFDETDFLNADLWASGVDGVDNKIGANDIVYFMDEGENFNDGLQVRGSGTSGKPITFKKYSTDTPTLSPNWYGILASGVDYLVFDGLKFTGVTYDQLYLLNSDHNEVTNCTFSGSLKNALKLSGSDYNYVHDNDFDPDGDLHPDDGLNDTLYIWQSDYNRIIENAFDEGGNHSTIFLSQSDYNVVRGNTLDMSKAYWDANRTDENYHVSETLLVEWGSDYNLFEDNVITYVGAHFESTDSEQVCFQLNASSYNIIRKNIWNNVKSMVSIYNTNGSNQYNQYYNNTFYNAGDFLPGYAFWHIDTIDGYNSNYNQFVNNIVHTIPLNRSIRVGFNNGAGALADHFVGNEARNNIFYNDQASKLYVDDDGGDTNFTSWANADSDVTYTGQIDTDGTITTEPTFTSLATGVFTATAGGSQIDAGTYLTLASAAGTTSDQLSVDDPYFFTYGWGISGETADYICIGIQGPILISSINHATKVITLPSDYTWLDNAEIRLATSSTACFYGSETDIGALEGEVPDAEPPEPDPATFSTSPNADAAGQIAMISSLGSDAGTASYQMLEDPATDSCGTDADYTGTGATDLTWQAGRTHTDAGLDTNQVYCYNVQMRDDVGTPNVGTASSTVKVYTLAAAPVTPVLANEDNTSMELTNDVNGNPTANPATLFTIQCISSVPADSTWQDKYVDASGDPQATAQWLTDAALDAMVMGDSTALNPGTFYGWRIKARNGDSVETAWSTTGYGTTTGPIPDIPPGTQRIGGTSQGGISN